MLRSGGVEHIGADTLLVARRLCDFERVICAAPSYLTRHGAPRTPDDLGQHNCLRLIDYPNLSLWPFKGVDGVRIFDVGGKHVANNAETVLQMGLAGMGIIRLVDVMVGAHLANRRLLPVLADSHHDEPVPLHLLMPRDKHRLPKVTVMIDFLVEKFASAPWRQPGPGSHDAGRRRRKTRDG